MSADPSEKMRERFNALNFNDCRLVKLSIGRAAGQQVDEVVLLIEMIPGPGDQIAPHRELRFQSCREVRLTIDLLGKSEMGDQLADCECRAMPTSGGAWLDPSAIGSDRADHQSPLNEFVIYLANFSRSKIRVIAANYVFEAPVDSSPRR